MTKFLISFPATAMDVPAEDMPAVNDAAHAVIREAKAAGVYVFGGGINGEVAPVMVAADGSAQPGHTARPVSSMEAFVCSSFRPRQLPFNGRPRSLRPAAVHKSFASSTTTLKADLQQLRDMSLPLERGGLHVSSLIRIALPFMPPFR